MAHVFHFPQKKTAGNRPPQKRRLTVVATTATTRGRTVGIIRSATANVVVRFTVRGRTHDRRRVPSTATTEIAVVTTVIRGSITAATAATAVRASARTRTDRISTRSRRTTRTAPSATRLQLHENAVTAHAEFTVDGQGIVGDVATRITTSMTHKMITSSSVFRSKRFIVSLYARLNGKVTKKTTRRSGWQDFFTLTTSSNRAL